jgi:arylsulfatase A-like enzyme
MKSQPNIVIIVMDAVRAQNLACYGYERNTMPLLEKEILPSAVLYEQAISSSYWTLPSIASTFTGTYMSTHGLVLEGTTLDPAFITLAEILQAKGYNTIGLSRTDYVSEFMGLDRGFTTFYNYEALTGSIQKIYRSLFRWKQKNPDTSRNGPSTLSSNASSMKLTDRLFWFFNAYFDKGAKKQNQVVHRIIRKQQSKPFCIYLHYNEPHAPYCPPNPHRDHFLPNTITKKIWQINQDRLRFHLGLVDMDQSEFEILQALYDGAINYTDTRVFEIFTMLQEEGALENTLFILTSDHGDNIGEHGLMGHIWCLYDTLIKIPLIIKYPEALKLSGTDTRLTQNVDLLPTILDLLNIKTPHALTQVQGNSLISPKIQHRSPTYAIAELMKPFSHKLYDYHDQFTQHDRGQLAIRSQKHKYIWTTDGRHEFYDIRNDPQESHNIIHETGPAMEYLKRELEEKWVSQFTRMYTEIQSHIRTPEKRMIASSIQDRLRALGYF